MSMPMFRGGAKSILYLDGNEVCLAFVGYSLGQKSLSAARGTIEQDPLGRGHPKLQELLWMFHRVLGGGGEIEKLKDQLPVYM